MRAGRGTIEVTRREGCFGAALVLLIGIARRKLSGLDAAAPARTGSGMLRACPRPAPAKPTRSGRGSASVAASARDSGRQWAQSEVGAVGMGLARLGAGCERGTDARPSVALVVMDTVRRDAVSAYGTGEGTTPHLDALAERLRAEGFDTAGFSENPLVSDFLNLTQGFDYFEAETVQATIRELSGLG